MNTAYSQTSVKRHPIQVVSRRSGLSIDVLRVWEKRYKLVAPERSKGGHRLYSDADIERLRLIREAMAGGRRVGQLADLSDAQLSSLVEEDRRETVTDTGPGRPRQTDGIPEALVADCLQAVRALDAPALKTAIDRAMVTLKPADFMDLVATPLMHKIGDLWHNGLLTPGHEHLASGVLRNSLGEMIAKLRPHNGSDRLVVATPSGQQHELGAVLVAATAQLEGWAVTYLGADLPGADIGQAAEQINAKAVLLSVTVDPHQQMLSRELEELRRSISRDVLILVGGQRAGALHNELSQGGARYVADLAQLRKALRKLSGEVRGA